MARQREDHLSIERPTPDEHDVLRTETLVRSPGGIIRQRLKSVKFEAKMGALRTEQSPMVKEVRNCG